MAERPTACNEGLNTPVKLVIANDPGIIPEQVEELDHHQALIGERELGALIDVANINQKRVWIFLPPAPDLRDTTRHSTEIDAAVIIDYGQDMAMQIGCVQKRNRDEIRRKIFRGAQPARHRTGRGGSAKQVEKFTTVGRTNFHVEGSRF